MKVVLEADSHIYTDTTSGETLPSVTQILGSVGLIDSRWYTDESRERGTEVHEAIHLINAGILDYSDYRHLDIYGYLEAYRRFVAQSGFEVRASERVVWHESMRYAGKIDHYGILNSAGVIIDFKTGSVQRWHGWQGEAYRLAWNSQCPDHPAVRFLICELRKDGKYSLQNGWKGKSFADQIWQSQWRSIVTVSYLRGAA